MQGLCSRHYLGGIPLADSLSRDIASEFLDRYASENEFGLLPFVRQRKPGSDCA